MIRAYTPNLCTMQMPQFITRATISLTPIALTSIRFSSQNTSPKASAYIDLARVHEKKNNPDKALEMLEKAIKIEEAISEDSASLGMYYNNAGTLCFNKKDYVKALEYFTKASEKQDSTHLNTYRTNLANTYDALSIQASNEKDFQKEIEHIEKALLIRNELGAGKEIISNYHNRLGAIYEDLGETTRAKEHFKHVSSENISIGVSCNNAGTRAFNEKNYTDALQHYSEAVETQAKIDPAHEYLPIYRANLANTHYAIGVLNQDQNKLDDARKHFEKALSLNEELPNREEESKVCYNRLGTLYEMQGNLDMAEKHFEKAL